MSIANRQRLYLLFFVSGFCSLVYQMVWTRLAFAAFGIITPVLSVVLSVFMLGLSVGSWAGGRVIGRLTRRSGLSAIFFYGAAEMTIGLGAFATPALFALGQRSLLAAGQTDSAQYLFLSAMVLAVSILPWCVCMGATFPFMMAYVREQEAANQDSFSYLYFANVLGAMTGTIVTAFVLVETMGFRHTLGLAAAGNFGIAAFCAGMGWQGRRQARAGTVGGAVAAPVREDSPSDTISGGLIRWILFTTGFCSMAMEVVWTRAFTPILKTQVYAFALIVFAYLAATFVGSLLYRHHLHRNARRPVGELMALLPLAACLPILTVDPRFLPVQLNTAFGNYFDSKEAAALTLGGICPMCGLLGYLTPGLVDRYAAGTPAAAGKAYAINVIGCILGPLCASYLLLPRLSEKEALVILCLPLLALGVLCWKPLPLRLRVLAAFGAGLALVWSLFFADDFEGLLKRVEVRTEVRRDYAASVISFGQGFQRMLLVNGVGMTILTPEPKFMVHLPMAMQAGRPDSVLVICFGMGTSYRSALSWDARTTAVELVPSVVEAFPFYHDDTASVLANPKGRIVIDDGRRYLERTRDQYDVIVIDPPPPPEAAGSSLLYSREFYELAREHLKPNGILQIWYPGGTLSTFRAVARSLAEAFPYVRCFVGVNGWGTHFLGSMQPMAPLRAEELVARMPANARQDLMEWMDGKPYPDLPSYVRRVLSSEQPIDRLLNPNPRIHITDDQPFNEYYLLRSWKVYAP